MLAGMIIRPRATSARTTSGVEPFPPGDERHLVGDDPLAGHFDLRHDANPPLRGPIDSPPVGSPRREWVPGDPRFRIAEIGFR